MIRLLIADDRQWIRQQLIDWLATIAQIEIVEIKDKQRTAISSIEKLRPDIVVFDLSMSTSDNFQTIATIARQYPHTKIMVVYDGNASLSRRNHDGNYPFDRALIAGVKGCLPQDSSRQDWLTALDAVYRGKIYFRAEIWQHNFQFLQSSPQFESRLKHWTMWLAKEVIACWRTQSPKKLPSGVELLAQLELSDNIEVNRLFHLLEEPSGEISLCQQLKLQIEQLKIGCQRQSFKSIAQKLQEAMQEIARSFKNERCSKKEFNYLLHLQTRTRNLRNEKIERFQKCLTALWRASATQPLLKLWQDLELSLIKLHQQYQSKYERHISRKNSAWRAYLHLKAKLNSEPSRKFTDRNRQLPEIYASKDWQAIWNAIYYFYEDTFSAEISRQASQLVAELLQQTRVYLKSLRQTEAFLEELQTWFEAQTNVNLLPIPIIAAHFLEKIDPNQLRDRLETSMGHSFNRWGTSSKISEQIIRELLLVELRPLALVIYADSYREAISLSIFENSFEDR
ncbi:MAG: response regulator [Xenococcaceae cyanobacterium]